VSRFSYLRYILGCVVLYNKKEKLDTYNPYIKLADKRTITNEWSEYQEKTTYGLWQRGIVGI